MTMILKDPQATFIHIPKTGGSSINAWLSDNAKGEFYHDSTHINRPGMSRHLTYQQVAQLSIEDNRDMGFTFTVVRNPWDRCVSSYFHWLRLQTAKGITDPLSFEQYIQMPPLGKAFAQPQVSFVGDCDYVMEFDTLNEDFKLIKKMFKKKKKLPHINAEKNRDHYSTYYGETSRRTVAERYGEDIDFFEYTFKSK
jgi:hypothetical protein